MLCPPVPWTWMNRGGYLIARNDFIRSTDPSVQLLRISEKHTTCIYPAVDALNEASNIPWRINGQLLNILVEIFNTIKKERLQPKSDQKQNPKSKLSQLKAKMKPKTGEICYKLLVANHFRDTAIWFPHNTDFRGRFFPIPQILDYTASDINRSLLMFHERKPLGTDGLQWLKIHCINLRGDMKQNTIQERLEYADRSMSEILDSADKPLDGDQWWLDSQEPWQTLACCMEIANAVRCTDPSQYSSGFPVYQDGTCNNLQHYAALTRSTALASIVNLKSLERPQDAYMKVVDSIEELRAHDANNGAEIAKALNAYITRKVLKQPITVSIYGGGTVKVQESIKKILKNLPEFPKELVEEAAIYLVGKHRVCFPEMFEAATQTQIWLKNCASYISEKYEQNMEWVTPLDWPVVQPYLWSDGQKNSPEFIAKNISAFAPNFIHSLESSHMILTSLNCKKTGITFISEHDSFGTHPCSVTEMNKICREQFVLLYSQSILEQLASFLSEKYPRYVDSLSV